MDWHITQSKEGWKLRRHGASKATAVFRLRREAIAAARAEVKKKDGVIYVHNSTGFVVVRIPELPAKEKVAAKVLIHGAGDMSQTGRKEIAAWLRSTAADLVKLGHKYVPTYRARYLYT